MTAQPMALQGYEVFLRDAEGPAPSMDFAVDGVRCAGCMAKIERHFDGQPGIVLARLNLAARRLTVVWEPGRVDPAAVKDALAALGFKAHPYLPGDVDHAEQREMRQLLRYLGVAAFAAMNIMLLSVSVWSGHHTGLDAEARTFFHWVSALIALPTAAYAGRPFYESAFTALRAGTLNMDVPITLGILLALIMSVVETANHAEHAYFDGAVMLIFFLLAGRVLDHATRRKTRDVARHLAALRASSVSRLFPDGSTREVPAAAVKPGDHIRVLPGDRIGVDGRVVAGRSDVDQSLVTGETAPVPVEPGHLVYAGTLNHGGVLTVETIKASDATLLADVERLLETATSYRSSYRRLADRAAQLYAPVVHVTALATFLGWVAFGMPWQGALVIAITVLIITCPCALGLAIPAVQVVASGALFRERILIHAGDALERLATVDTVVLDKTGTLTMPDPELLDPAVAEQPLFAGAVALAQHSRHPLARVLANAGGGSALPRLKIEGLREVPGEGLEAEADGATLRLGSPNFCAANAEAEAMLARFPEASLIAFRHGDEALVVPIGQKLRPHAASTVRDLRALGVEVRMLSGDRSAAVEACARALDIRHFTAGARPSDKIAELERLRAEGRRVLMVGDGINDAPALAAAHVSMAPVGASSLAQASADLVMLGDSLRPVPSALIVARRARRIMGENLWLSVIYNAIAVPIAIAGLATPLVAAAAMSGSSILVTLNALRARLGETRA